MAKAGAFISNSAVLLSSAAKVCKNAAAESAIA